jgi:glycosyltransferase involved in cell wall biosynthesis
MTTRPHLSVVVPAYQEASTIELAHERLAAELKRLETSYEIIVVSDGSTDDTALRAQSTELAALTVVEYHPNQGKGHALRFGVDRSRGEIIVFIDGDLDIHPSGITRLLQQLSDDVYAVVASKVHPEATVQYPAFRRFQSQVFRRLVRGLFSLDVADTQTGLKVFRREVLERCLPLVHSSGFLFDLELLVLANDAGYAVTEGPVDLDYQFSTTTGSRAVLHMLQDLLRLEKRRFRERRRGSWIEPTA